MMAIVYAANSKPSCFTGFIQHKTGGRNYHYTDFVAARALPGPDSVVTCVVQSHGPVGRTEYRVLQK